MSEADPNLRTYTVQTTCAQAERWQAAAAAHGHRTVGAWLKQNAEDYLRELARTGRPRPLTWRRGRFRVTFSDTSRQSPVSWEEEVAGLVSACGCFGIFHGDSRGPGKAVSLAHRPTRRIIGTLRRMRTCKALAAGLSALQIAWSETDPERVVEGAPDQEKAQDLLRLYEKLEKR